MNNSELEMIGMKSDRGIDLAATTPSASSASAALQRVRKLVKAFGWNATAYQIINPGISHWFSAVGDAVIGYVEHHRVRVVAGAPVCAGERLAEVVAEFERDAAHGKIRVCYFGAEARLESCLAGSPRHSRLWLGAQPSWRPQGWAGIFARQASLRAQLNRARNKAVTVSEWPVERASGHPELRRCLSEWLATRGLPPMHFLVEPQTLERLYDRRVFVAERRGAVIGFLVSSPVPLRNGWLIEQIVRGAGAVNGANELLVDAAVRAAADSGSDYITLGLSPLSNRGVASSDSNPLWLRWLLAWARAHGQRFYNFEGLDTFKAKFQPERWEPVYAIANEPQFSPAMLYAIAAAFTAGRPVGAVAHALWRAISQEAKWLMNGVRNNRERLRRC
ncbi:MAG: phosphatidylglycerol lysyltransferase domain-containing protein [Blastocatellia bacterium]